jgi:pimeloyl-ACP methyl ester carboxylesterase
MRSHYVDVAGLQLHLRVGGEGPPVVMLHPSPLSSTAILPIAEELAHHFRVYAFDTPGYGLSDPLPRKPESLDDYLPVFAQALDALGLARICLYGCATGAQFAVEFAKRWPARVELLMLDTAGHIDADECERIVRDYFPDVTPQPDGRHLVTLWQMVRDLFVFFPWCDARDVSRVDRDLPPPAVMHGMLLDYLRAGARYDWAYRPAFYNERAERTRAVRVPVVLTRWQGSIALRITDALIDSGLPPNFEVLRLGPSMAERIEGIVAHLRARHRTAAAPTTLPPRAVGRCASSAGLQRLFIDTSVVPVHARFDASGSGAPLVLLHSATGSGALLARAAAGWAGRRPVFVLDLPGHGESPWPADAKAVSAAPLAVAVDAVDAAVSALGFDEVEILGQHYGALVGLEYAARRPRQVRSLTAVGLPWLLAEESVAAGEDAAPSIVPAWDGTHLIRAWYMMRDSALWFPQHRKQRSHALRSDPRFDARAIHERVVELMKIGDRYRDVLRAQAEYPLAQRLGEARIDLVLGRVPGDGFGARAEFAARAAVGARVVDLPRDPSAWAAALD